jgi:serine/threonine protein phosphatase PrpC
MAENYFGITDTGKTRSNNEDTFIAEKVLDDQFIVACVIDGVGGYEGGEVAATLARDSILQHLQKPVDNIILRMQEAVAAANNAIYAEKKVNSDKDQMACVLTLALVDISNNKFYFAHVGDTRLYLMRDNSLVKVTRDHSFVGFLEDSGRLTEEAAMRHPKRNEINKALGFDANINSQDYVETGESPFLPGDMILLCSDGLSDMIDNSTMTNILNSDKSLSSKGKLLIDAANDAGGKDNITVVLVHNNKAPLKQTATKPIAGVKKNDGLVTPAAVDLPPADNTPITTRTTTTTKKKSGMGTILSVLGFLLLGTLLWLIYQNYYNKKQHEQNVANVVVEKKRNEREQVFVDSINNPSSKEVFVLNEPGSPAIIISDSINIEKDSLHIIGNGVTLIRDTTYNGPALTLSPNCKHIYLDSLTLENFDIGVLTRNEGLHLRNVQFINCRVPVQYQLMFQDQRIINGRFADTIFYNSDVNLNNH